MISHGYAFMVLVLVLSVSTVASGETVFVTDQFQAGLHEDKSPDTPIIKTVPSGTALEIIKREKSFTYVRDTQGVSGWIDNSYLVKETPNGAELGKLKAEKESIGKKLEDANQKITRLQENLAASGRQDPSDLQQQLNSERLKTGELQIEVAELKKRLGQDSNSEPLYQQIENLKEKNMTLEIQLAGAQQESGAANSGGQREGTPGLLKQDWKRTLLYVLIYILIGTVLGIYVMDYYNRRRHGGFRV